MKTKKTVIVLLSALAALVIVQSCEKMERNLSDPMLVAAFESNRREVKIGDTVKFKDISEGLPSRWSWTFEGGSPNASIAHSPVITYDTPGSYPVTLRVTREGLTDSLTIADFIVVGYWDVEADFSMEETTILQGESVAFTDLSAGFPDAWNWEITSASGVTITADEQHPEVMFETPGIYSVKLTVSNAASSDEVSRESVLTVLSANAIQADFAADLSSTYAGGAITFEDISTGDPAVSWNWTFEGGTPATSTEQSPTVTYAAPGRYTVTLEAFDGVTSSVKSIENHVLVIPSDGLVAFYPFDGHGNDIGPLAIHPEIIGTVGFDGEDRNAAGGRTAVFNGQGLLLVPDHDGFNFGTEDFTISLWMRSPHPDRMMVWQESGGNGGGDNQTWLRLNNNAAQQVRFHTADAAGTGTNWGEPITDNAWHQVVCVREGTAVRLYIDGQLMSEATGPTPRDVSNTQPFKIGAQATGGGTSYNNYFAGMIDDFAVFNRALSEQEVQNLFNLR